jgi:hypothetical protein
MGMQVSNSGPPKRWSRWSAAEFNTLGELERAGINIKLIAETLGRSCGSAERLRRTYFPRPRATHCQTCGTPLTDQPVGRPREYCNATCRYAGRRCRAGVRACTCVQCGIPFLSPRVARYCSKACGSRAWYERARVNPAVHARKLQLAAERRTPQDPPPLSQPRHVQALADAVATRRRQLGLTRPQLAARMGLAIKVKSVTVILYKIEHAQYLRGPERATLTALNQGLGWTPGSAHRLLYHGTRPIPIV